MLRVKPLSPCNSILKYCLFPQNDVSPNPKKTCGPYKPHGTQLDRERYNRNINKDNHDTVGMLVMDHHGNMAVGTSTNGATHKIPGYGTFYFHSSVCSLKSKYLCTTEMVYTRI